MEIESMKSGATASYQGSATTTSAKTLDTAVQPEASTQAGLSQTADKKPTVQNFFTEKDQEDKDLSEEKDAKQGTQLKKAVNDLNKQMKNSEAIFGRRTVLQSRSSIRPQRRSSRSIRRRRHWT